MFSIHSWPAHVRGLCVVAVVLASLARAWGAGEARDPSRLTHHPIEPLAEALDLVLDPQADGFSGTARVHLIAHVPARTIRLYAQDLELGFIALSPRVGSGNVPLTIERGELGLLMLTAPAGIAPGAYDLEIRFTGKYRRDGVGLYKTEVEGEPYLFTQLEARFGRLAFPSWDEPAFKMPWQITLTVPAGLAAFSNSAVVDESNEDGRKTIVFARTPPMPTYLVAFVVGPFESVSVPGLAVPGRIITVRGQSALTGQIATESPKILAALEDYFGMPYPYGKLDQVAVPEYNWGGMENAALITYLDSAVLRAPGDDDLANRRGLVQIVAHEMAHHWFGDLVTMEWWNDLWLNESFASWMEGKVLDTAYPELRFALNSAGGKQRAMRIDALPSTGPVRREISAADDPEKFVDDLSYQKGEAVLTMIEAWIGPDVFRAAMKRYFEKHRWGSTRAEDLWEAFGQISGEDVPAIASGFIEQPGVPQISIEVMAGDRVRLRQKRYAALGGALPESSAGLLWRVPLVFKYGTAEGGKTARVLLMEREQTVVVPGITAATWIFPNAAEAGYYRWQLEPGREAELRQRGLVDLTALERLGLLFNAAAMHEAGELSPARHLALLVEFTRDADVDVARRAVDAIMRMCRVYLDDGDGAELAAFYRAVFRPMLDRIRLRPSADEAPEIAALRRELIVALGIRGGDGDVLAMARGLAWQLVKDPRSVDAALADAVLDVAVWHGDAALFEACETAFREAKVPTDRRMFLGALGGFGDPALCERALVLALGAGMRSQEHLTVAWSMIGGSMSHRAMVVAWMMAHFDAIRASASDFDVSMLIILAEGGDAALFARAREFLLAPGRTSDAAEKVIAEATDRDAQRQALRVRGQAEVRQFIAHFPVEPANRARP